MLQCLALPGGSCESWWCFLTSEGCWLELALPRFHTQGRGGNPLGAFASAVSFRLGNGAQAEMRLRNTQGHCLNSPSSGNCGTRAELSRLRVSVNTQGTESQ